MATSINPATKVNLGILGVLIVASASAAAYATSIKNSVDAMATSIDKNTKVVETLAEQSRIDGQTLAVLRAQVVTLEKRIDYLDKR